MIPPGCKAVRAYSEGLLGQCRAAGPGWDHHGQEPAAHDGGIIRFQTRSQTGSVFVFS